MNKLTDKEYEELKQRVADGKRILYMEKNEMTMRDRNEWTTIFFELSDELIRQTIIRGLLTSKRTKLQPWRIEGETPDEYVIRMREKMYPKKGGRKRKKHNQLFGESKIAESQLSL